MTFSTKAKIVLLACAFIELVNCLFLSLAGPAIRKNQQTVPWHSQYVYAQAFVFPPFILIPCLILLFGMMYWALKPPSTTRGETSKLVVLALAAFGLLGLITTWVFISRASARPEMRRNGKAWEEPQ